MIKSWKRLSNPEIDYCMKGRKRLSERERDCQSLKEIIRAWKRLSKPDGDYQSLKETIRA